MVALNGPSLPEFKSSGMLHRALSYFFSIANRSIRTPLGYLDHEDSIKLDKLRWGTTCQFPSVVDAQARFEREQKEASLQIERLTWPNSNDSETGTRGAEESGSDDEDDAEASIGRMQATLDQLHAELDVKRYSKRKAPTSAPVTDGIWSTGSTSVRRSKKRKRSGKSATDSNSTNTSASSSSCSSSSSSSAATAVSDPTELRAVRSRVGRIVRRPEFLSFNHHDESSATYLFYSNV